MLEGLSLACSLLLCNFLREKFPGLQMQNILADVCAKMVKLSIRQMFCKVLLILIIFARKSLVVAWVCEFSCGGNYSIYM